MLRENIEEQCRRISPDAYSKKSVCAFAPHDRIVGFIDTSVARDGSRGIAFFGDRMCVNTDGEPREVAYEKIINTHIISSFEDSFADELSVSSKGAGELRISDYSLDKFELKKLLDELCKEREHVGERSAGMVEEYAEIIAQKLADNAQNRDAEHIEKVAKELKKSAVIEERPVVAEFAAAPVIYEETPPVIGETVVDIPEERSPLPEGYAPAPIPEEKIDWISGTVSSAAPGGASVPEDSVVIAEAPVAEKKESDIPEKDVRPKLPEVINGVIDRIPMIGDRKPSTVANADNTEKTEGKKQEAADQPKNGVDETEPTLTESELRERIENMSSDEMMEFLSDTLKEINRFDGIPDVQYDRALQTVPIAEGDMPPSEYGDGNVPEKTVTKWKTLTVEPIWGDIYIKASQSLRQLCESGKLTMEQMEDELRTRLLSAAEAFEQITGDDSRVPKVMIPKITELKLAADNFDRYFAYGEDVAIRAMFFMQYQMLTYADRIANSPETKGRINDFFRRFGGAMITLSMLDMRG